MPQAIVDRRHHGIHTRQACEVNAHNVFSDHQQKIVVNG
jgi:hypothetical protein